MELYHLIGADGRQYGPVTADQIRQWIGEGRLTARMLLRCDASDWKPLAEFPEFAGAAGAVPPVATGPMACPAPALKSRIAAGLLGVFLPFFGVHRFYLGYIGVGIAQIIVSIVTLGLGALWGFIEGICILAGVGITRDARGCPLRE
jgi:hypothetical protein